MLSPKKLLENAHNRIAKRENWGKGSLAGSKRSQYDDVLGITSALNPDATCWCALGALAAEAGVNATLTSDLARQLPSHAHLNEAIEALGKVITNGAPSFAAYYNDVFYLNDRGTHEQVLDVFDKAIASLQGE